MLKLKIKLNNPSKSLPRVKELYYSIQDMESFAVMGISPRIGCALIEGKETAIKKFKKLLEREYVKSMETL